MREDDGSIVPLVASETLADALYGVAVERPSRALPEIRCPALLVAATETLERFGQAPLERFRAAVPHGDVLTLDSGHDVLADARDETIAAVGDFVTRWS
jgi:pimeloyl-ACP methyl ester carboxylesterase